MVFRKIWNFLSFWYFQYTLNTSLYMMEPLERRAFNTILIAVIAMVLYTSYLFLPGHALMIIQFLTRLMGGQGDEEAATVPHMETS